jgi:hypothetical protein
VTITKNALTCGHCSAVFSGSVSQAWHVKQGGGSYCSEVCRFAFLRKKFSTPVPNRGPCGGCGSMFASRRDSKFCGMKCYTGSKQFSEMLADNLVKGSSPWSIARRAALARRGEEKPCLECGTNVYAKKSDMRKKYCGTVCYRAYMAKRFDRHIANPEELALPQGFDAFLDRNELPCLVVGCGWRGKHLSLHTNQMHGIVAADLKRAAGFNKSTGLVSKPLAEVLQARSNQGVAADADMRALGAHVIGKSHVLQYCSLEAKEHQTKARALSGPGPMRACRGCGSLFQQFKAAGRALYCCVSCRSSDYSRRAKVARSGMAAVPMYGTMTDYTAETG